MKRTPLPSFPFFPRAICERTSWCSAPFYRKMTLFSFGVFLLGFFFFWGGGVLFCRAAPSSSSFFFASEVLLPPFLDPASGICWKAFFFFYGQITRVLIPPFPSRSTNDPCFTTPLLGPLPSSFIKKRRLHLLPPSRSHRSS